MVLSHLQRLSAEHAAVVFREASLDVPHVEVDHVVFVHIRPGLVSGDVVVGGCYWIREREDECRGDVRCAHCVVVEGVEGAEDVCLEVVEPQLFVGGNG